MTAFSALVAFLVAIAVATVLTPVVRKIALRLGAIDAPGGRRVHVHATARMGGAAVVIAYGSALVSTMALGVFPWSQRTRPVLVLATFFAGGVFLALIGVFDDIRAVGAKRKLLAQVVAATIAWYGGARIESINIANADTITFALPIGYLLSVVWILAFINAINLIDGLDGLAGGLVLFAAVTNSVIAFTTGNYFALTMNAALAGAVLGFLFYNFNPATIFLGDTGSMFLGYVLGTSALLTGRQKESTLASLLVPVLALGLPLTDTLFTMVRRFLARRPIFSADRGHIHHRLLDVGLTHRRAVLILYGCTLLLCLSAFAAAFGQNWQVGAALVGAVCSLAGVARLAGYFAVAQKKRARRAALLSAPTEALRRSLPRLLVDIEHATTLTSTWKGFETLLDVGHFSYAEYVLPEAPEPLWRWQREETRQEATLVVTEFPMHLIPGGPEGILRFGCLLEQNKLPPQVEVLLQLVVDAVEAALTRTSKAPPRSSNRRAAIGRGRLTPRSPLQPS